MRFETIPNPAWMAASTTKFINEIICKVFRAKDEEPRENSGSEQKYATHAIALDKKQYLES
ncbi:hypothetical protein [Pseudomonas salomonii]|uniref:hypothetical protein n=1 Tax=Pseudomonas salomonii TaxID=191391 RepID=UPI0011C482CC|nr:hypothetical protein [Pseudomonas salomonii]